MGIVLLLLVKFYKKDQAICQSILNKKRQPRMSWWNLWNCKSYAALNCTFPDYSDLATLFCRVIQFPGITSPIYLLSGSVDSLHHLCSYSPPAHAPSSAIEDSKSTFQRKRSAIRIFDNWTSPATSKRKPKNKIKSLGQKKIRERIEDNRRSRETLTYRGGAVQPV